MAAIRASKPSDEEVSLLLIRGQVASLTDEQQQRVKGCAQQLREAVNAAETLEEGTGYLALALVATELNAERS